MPKPSFSSFLGILDEKIFKLNNPTFPKLHSRSHLGDFSHHLYISESYGSENDKSSDRLIEISSIFEKPDSYLNSFHEIFQTAPNDPAALPVTDKTDCRLEVGFHCLSMLLSLPSHFHSAQPNTKAEWNNHPGS